MLAKFHIFTIIFFLIIFEFAQFRSSDVLYKKLDCATSGSSEIAPVPKDRFICPRVEGYYADPENCRWFFACLDHVRDGVTPLTAYEFRCPFGLVFNEQTLTCDWPWNVAGCGSVGSFRAHLTVGDILEGRTRASYATLPDYHISGGRIENAAGGVVLGSLLPGVVGGHDQQSAYISTPKYNGNSYQGSEGFGSFSNSDKTVANEHYYGGVPSGLFSKDTSKHHGVSELYSGILRDHQLSDINGIHSRTGQHYSENAGYAGSGHAVLTPYRKSDQQESVNVQHLGSSSIYANQFNERVPGSIHNTEGKLDNNNGKYFGTGYFKEYTGTGLKSTLQETEYRSGEIGSLSHRTAGLPYAANIKTSEVAFGSDTFSPAISYDDAHFVSRLKGGVSYVGSKFGIPSGVESSILHETPETHSIYGPSVHKSESAFERRPVSTYEDGSEYKNIDFVHSLTANQNGLQITNVFSQNNPQETISSTPATSVNRFQVSSPISTTLRPLESLSQNNVHLSLSTPRPLTYYIPPKSHLDTVEYTSLPIDHDKQVINENIFLKEPVQEFKIIVPSSTPSDLVVHRPISAFTVSTPVPLQAAEKTFRPLFNHREAPESQNLPVPLPSPVIPLDYQTPIPNSKPVVPVGSALPPIVANSPPLTPAVSYRPRPYSVLIEGYRLQEPVLPLTDPSVRPVLPVSIHTQSAGFDKNSLFPGGSTSVPAEVSFTTPAISLQYSTPRPTVTPVSSTFSPVDVSPSQAPPSPVKFRYSYSTPVPPAEPVRFDGYHYSQPSIGSSHLKPQSEVLNSITTPTSSPSPRIVSTAIGSSITSFKNQPLELQRIPITVTESPLAYSTPVPSVTTVLSPPARVNPIIQSNDFLHTYPKPVIPIVPIAPYHYNVEPAVKYEVPTFSKLPLASSSQVVHFEGNNRDNYKLPLLYAANHRYSYSDLNAVQQSKDITATPERFYSVPSIVKVSEVDISSNDKQIPSAVITPLPVRPIEHASVTSSPLLLKYNLAKQSIESNSDSSIRPDIYLSSPRPFAATVFKNAVPTPYTQLVIPTAAPNDYDNSHRRPTPTVLPKIHVTSTPITPLSPLYYNSRFNSYTDDYNQYGSLAEIADPFVPLSPIFPYASAYPLTKTEPIHPSVALSTNTTPSYVKPLPSISNSNASLFEGFAHLGPKYKLVNIYPPAPFETSGHSASVQAPSIPIYSGDNYSFKFGYVNENPKLRIQSSTPNIEYVSISSQPVISNEFKSTSNPPIYVPPVLVDTDLTKQTVNAPAVSPIVSSTLTPVAETIPQVPIYEKIVDAFKTPLVSAYEKVLNVLKTSTPAPVYVNHYTSSSQAHHVLPVTTEKPLIDIPHRFEYIASYNEHKTGDDSLYETLRNEFGSKLTSKQGYDYQKPVEPLLENIQEQQVPSTTYRPILNRIHTIHKPNYIDTYKIINQADLDRVQQTSTAVYDGKESYTPSDFKQYIHEVQPVIKPGANSYNENFNNRYDKVQFVASSSPFPPVTTARVSLPIIPPSECIDCGSIKSQNIRIKPQFYPPTTSSPFRESSSSTKYISPLPALTSSTLGYSENVEELEIANEEQEGAKILEEYSSSGQFGSILNTGTGSDGIINLRGSSTTVSSLKDGEAVVGVVKKEKNIYTGRKDKAKVVIVSRLSDFNPILIGKLGAECSCKSNSLNLKNHRIGDISNDGINNRFTINVPETENPDRPIAIVPSNLEPIIVPDGVQYQSSNVFAEKSGRLSPASKVVPLEKLASLDETIYTSTHSSPLYFSSPSTSTLAYDENVKSLISDKFSDSSAQNKPMVYSRKNLRPSDQQVLVPTIPAQTIVDLHSETETKSGKSFDRYGPGGWRGLDETLQGSVDCKRPGLFRHPKYCKKFYSCNWDQWKKRFTLHVFNCPVHLAYDTNLGACNWPSKGPSCADDNLLV